MKVLAIDLAINNIGLVFLDEGKAEEGYQPQLLSEKRNKSARAVWIDPSTAGMERFCIVADKIITAVRNWLPEVIVIEDFSYGSTGQAVFDLGQINGIVRYRLHEIGFSEKNGNFMKVTPGQAKKAACGKGNAGKMVVVNGVIKQTKVNWIEEFDDAAEHICDAIALILYLKERRKALTSSSGGPDTGCF